MASPESNARWRRDASIACGAGAAAAVVMGLAAFAVGRVSGSEARVLVDAILPTSRFLCSAVMTACATILALMLTLLGMTIRVEVDLNTVFYRRIKQIAFYNMLLLIASTCVLLIQCVPITKSEEIPSWWYSTAYYAILAAAAVISGALITIVTMLYAAIRDVIDAFGLNDDVGAVLAQDRQRTDEPQNA